MAAKNNEKMPAQAAIRAQIDENLKRAYQQVLTEEVPDRLKELLDQLKARDTEPMGEKK